LSILGWYDHPGGEIGGLFSEEAGIFGAGKFGQAAFGAEMGFIPSTFGGYFGDKIAGSLSR
jgi:hypothetical protein